MLILKGCSLRPKSYRPGTCIRLDVPLDVFLRIRLLEYRQNSASNAAPPHKHMMRDRLYLPYRHRTLPSGEMTLDHVVPRSRAGETAWENLVACCHPCNNRKGSRTPEEAAA